VAHYVDVATLHITSVTPGWASDELPPSTLRCLRFTFEIEAGALRRKLPDALARSMHDAGLDVSWTDTRSGLFGVVRRFTVDGSAHLVSKLIDELAASIGWQPGPVALPVLARG
jgi:hypothetical protein